MGRISHKSSRVVRNNTNCGLMIACVLAFLLAGSVGLLLWQMLSLHQKFGRVEDYCLLNKDVWKLYPGYFKTIDDQAKIDSLRLSNVNLTRTFASTSCKFDCVGAVTTAPGSPAISPRLAANAPRRVDSPQPQQDNGGPFLNFFSHSCCSSGRRHIAPIYRKNLVNVEREIVQDKVYKQYFLEESCDQDTTCRGCTCSQPEPNIYQAVVYKDKSAESVEDMFEIDMIKVAGACKCLNM